MAYGVTEANAEGRQRRDGLDERTRVPDQWRS
jgi:hypothetical protein